MTRINCIPVQYLTDQHLMAEYREITRVSKLARPLDNYGTYKLGSGHVKFFYNKGLYLADRCAELLVELKERGYDVTEKVYIPHPTDELNQWWLPDVGDMLVNIERLQERVAANPNHYTYFGDKISNMFLDVRTFYRGVELDDYYDIG